MNNILLGIAERLIKIYQKIDGLTYHLQTTYQKNNDCLIACLSIKNQMKNTKKFNQSFPNIKIAFNQNISYLIPKGTTIYSNKDISVAANYGSIMPFAFIGLNLQNSQQRLIIIIEDQEGSFKQIRFKKQLNTIRFSATYYDLILTQGQTIRLPKIKIIKYKGQVGQSFIKSTINLYRKQQHIQTKASYRRFHQSFVLRVIEFYELERHKFDKRVDSIENFSIVQLIKEDQQLIGKIQFIHLRDWAAQGDSMKTKFGNYLTQNMVGSQISPQWLKNQIRAIQNAHGCGVGLYIQGYLVSKALLSENILKQFTQMQMRDSNNLPYTQWGSSNLVLCNSSQKWRNMLSETIQKLFNYFQVDGVYIDQFGFGSKTSHYKICTNNGHDHKQFDLQKGQILTLKQINFKSKNKQINIYIEQTPNEQAIKFIDGSLSTQAKNAAKNFQIVPLLLTRFIYSNFKIYEIITEYSMAQSDQTSKGSIIKQDVKQIMLGIFVAFWNGNGIYVPKNIRKYNQKILKQMKKCNFTFSLYKDYFLGQNPQPLAIYDQKLGVNQIIGNRFFNKFGNSIYTLLNFSQSIQKLCLNQKTNISMGGYSLALYVNDVQKLIQVADLE